MLDENQSKLSEDLMEFRRDASMLNVRMGLGPGVGRACAQLAAGLLLVKLLLRWGSLWGSLQLAGSASPRFGLFLLGLGVGEGFL